MTPVPNLPTRQVITSFADYGLSFLFDVHLIHIPLTTYYVCIHVCSRRLTFVKYITYLAIVPLVCIYIFILVFHSPLCQSCLDHIYIYTRCTVAEKILLKKEKFASSQVNCVWRIDRYVMIGPSVLVGYPYKILSLWLYICRNNVFSKIVLSSSHLISSPPINFISHILREFDEYTRILLKRSTQLTGK